MISANEQYRDAFIKVIKREFNRIITRRTLYILYFIVPIFMFVLFAAIYMNSVVRGIPVAIYDEDHSELSYLITRYVASSGSMKIINYANSLEEIKSEFREGNIKGAFYFPSNMEKDIKSGKQSAVSLFINAQNIIISNYLLSDGSKIIKTVSGGILLKKLKSAGLMDEQAMNIINPIKIETSVLYNPNYSYENYLVPGLTTFSIMMIIIVSSVLIISSEFTHNTFKDLVELSRNRISVIILGKIIPHLTVHTVNIIILVGLIFPLFHINNYGSSLSIILFMIFFALVTLSLGIMISSFFHNQMFATELALFIVTPAFIFSGLTYPLWSMPAGFRFIADLIPYTYFLSGYIKIAQMNAPLKYLVPDLISLAIFLLVALTATVIGLRNHISKSLLQIEEGV